MRYALDHYNPTDSAILDTSMFTVPILKTPIRSYPSYLNPQNPKVFGPPLWKILHSTANQLKPSPLIDTRYNIIKLLTKSLPTVIPCSDCRQHYVKMTKQQRPDLLFSTISSNNLQIGLQKYLYDIHNKVNVRKNKPIFPENNLWVYYSVDIPSELREYRKLLQPSVDKGSVSANNLNTFIDLIKSLI
jgi:hypothetical protein